MLVLEGHIVADVEIQPRRVAFGQLSKRAEASRELALKVPEPDKIKITKVSLDDERFELVLKDGELAGDSTYEVRFKGAEKLDRVKGRVRIEFSGSDVPHIDVPLWGQIVGDLRYPATLSFYKKKAEFPMRKVTFTSRTEQPVHVLGVKDNDEHLDVELVKPKGDMALIELKVKKPGEIDKPTKGVLEVKTSDRDEPLVEIKYTIFPGGRLQGLQNRVQRPGARSKPKLPPKGK